MKKALTLILIAVTGCGAVAAQTQQQQPNKPADDVLRITTELVQVDAVVADKNDQVIPDLKLSDFSLYENGKRQELKFVEYVGADSKARVDGNVAAAVSGDSDIARNLSATEVHHVFAFIVDDLTIPVADMSTVRSVLSDFVDKRMGADDLVAIVRVVGGTGLLQQFTSDKQLLHRAIQQLTPSTHPFSAFNDLQGLDRFDPMDFMAGGGGGGEVGSKTTPAKPSVATTIDDEVTLDGYTRGSRALFTLTVAGNVIDSMRSLPGRKNMVLFSGGLPIFESNQSQVSIDGAPITIQETSSLSTGVNYLLRQLTDRASRAGVAINTMDVRGLKASRGVSSFTDPGNEAKSGLGRFDSGGATFGRAPDLAIFDNTGLDTLTGHQGLEALSDATGGVSVANTNDFGEGLDRVLARSSYYVLAYKPTEPFDGKFHKLQIKVDRPGAKVYTRVGYVAKADDTTKPLTKEQAIVRAAMAPLAKREVDVSGAIQYRFVPQNRAVIDVNLRIDAGKLDIKQASDGKYQTALDVVGFVIDRFGKTEAGFSETLSASLTPDEYKRAVTNGIGYMGRVELTPGSYQLRVAVRETATGRLGTLSRYLEVPDMSKKRFTASSVFLHAITASAGAKAQPAPLTALRQISRKDDLRFSVVVYNAKLDKDKPQLSTRLTISRPDKVIFQGPIEGVDLRGADTSQAIRIGQIGLSKLSPGHYYLTLEVTDNLADKKNQTLVRGIDFSVID
ncbi:MAG TPA: VWA domain-containing protein [Pyrinomonadaceae bacterium]|nr:VWA domain-containing protein [Pyrinomonadaceae bacterium]